MAIADCSILASIIPSFKSAIVLNSQDCCQTSGIVECENGRIIGLTLNRQKANGTIPKDIYKLSALKNLIIGENIGLQGNIPSEIGLLSNLLNFHLYKTSVSGFIPKSLGDLRKLVVLYLDDNQLSGPVPPELGNLTKLENIAINNNLNLVGPIPAEWATLNITPDSTNCGGAEAGYCCNMGGLCYLPNSSYPPHCGSASPCAITGSNTSASGENFNTSSGNVPISPFIIAGIIFGILAVLALVVFLFFRHTRVHLSKNRTSESGSKFYSFGSLNHHPHSPNIPLAIHQKPGHVHNSLLHTVRYTSVNIDCKESVLVSKEEGSVVQSPVSYEQTLSPTQLMDQYLQKYHRGSFNRASSIPASQILNSSYTESQIEALARRNSPKNDFVTYSRMSSQMSESLFGTDSNDSKVLKPQDEFSPLLLQQIFNGFDRPAPTFAKGSRSQKESSSWNLDDKAP